MMFEIRGSKLTGARVMTAYVIILNTRTPLWGF